MANLHLFICLVKNTKLPCLYLDTHVFVLFFSPVTNKRFVLSQYLGGIAKNESGYITKAEATSMSYGIKYTPELNKNTGALVCYITIC